MAVYVSKLYSLPGEVASSFLSSLAEGQQTRQQAKVRRPLQQPADSIGQFASKFGLTRQVVNLLDVQLITKTQYQIGESLEMDRATEIDAATLRTLVYSYFVASVWRESRNLPSNVQYEREIWGKKFDICAKVKGLDFYIVLPRYESEFVLKNNYKDYVDLLGTLRPLEGWIVTATGNEMEQLLEPVQTWENAFIVPKVRIISIRRVLSMLDERLLDQEKTVLILLPSGSVVVASKMMEA